MKYIKLFEEYNIKNEYVSRDELVGYSKEKQFFDTENEYYDINSYFEKLPNKLTLERILYIEPNGKLGADKLGIHFTFPDDRYPQFLWKIGVLDQDMEKDEMIDILDNLKLVTVEVNKSDIDFSKTVYHRINYIEENEITLVDNAKIDIKSIDKYEWDEEELEYPHEY